MGTLVRPMRLTRVDCRLAVLSRADFRTFLRKDPDIALGDSHGCSLIGCAAPMIFCDIVFRATPMRRKRRASQSRIGQQI